MDMLMLVSKMMELRRAEAAAFLARLHYSEFAITQSNSPML